MTKMPSKATMVKREVHETKAQEAKESPAYQRREKAMGVEKHGAGKKKGY